MVSATDVKALNSKIEKLNTARTKAETQRELLGDSLERELKAYEEKYGKSLKGKTFAETMAAINKELEAVSAKVTEEYNLKSQIVEAVENQDYALAYKLLGVEPEQEEVDEPEDEVVEEASVEPVKVAETIESGEDAISDDTEDLEELLGSVLGDEDEDEFAPMPLPDMESEEPEPVKPQSKPAVKVQPKPQVKAQSKSEPPIKLKISDMPVSKAPHQVSPNKINLGGINFDDDDDLGLPELDQNDFGFGNALENSQFKL